MSTGLRAPALKLRRRRTAIALSAARQALQPLLKLRLPESEGKLFYSAEMLAQVAVAPGLMRQSALLDFKVMQGELTRVTIVITGAGEITRVQGEQVLAWNVEPIPNSGDARLAGFALNFGHGLCAKGLGPARA